MATDFTIDALSWHTSLDPDPAFQKRVRERFKAVVSFLERNGLTKSQLLPPGADIKDNFELNSSDLTDEGLELMKKAYRRWQKSQDKSKTPGDVSILEKELGKLRNK